ncbi:unnamed protein product, partial [Staurois parvus]
MTAGTGSSGIGSSGSTAGIGSPGMPAGTGSSAGIGSPGMTAGTGSSGIGSSGSTAGHRVTRLNHGRQVLRRQAHRFGYWQDGTGWKEFSLFSGFNY